MLDTLTPCHCVTLWILTVKWWGKLLNARVLGIVQCDVKWWLAEKIGKVAVGWGMREGGKGGKQGLRPAADAVEKRLGSFLCRVRGRKEGR
jgi:hypothetical protein